jgi:hypothetical protein
MKLNQKGQGLVEAVAIVGFILVLFLTLTDLHERSMRLSMEGINTRVGVIEKAARQFPSRLPSLVMYKKNVALPLDSLKRKKDRADVRSTLIY